MRKPALGKSENIKTLLEKFKQVTTWKKHASDLIVDEGWSFTSELTVDKEWTFTSEPGADLGMGHDPGPRPATVLLQGPKNYSYGSK